MNDETRSSLNPGDPTPADQVRYLTVAEVAQILTVTEAQVRRWRRKGRLKATVLLGRVLFLSSDVADAIPRIHHLLGRPQRIAPST